MSLQDSFDNSAPRTKIYHEVDGRSVELGELVSTSKALAFWSKPGAGIAECAAYVSQVATENPDKNVDLKFNDKYYQVPPGKDGSVLAAKIAGQAVAAPKGTFSRKPRIPPETMKAAIEGDDLGALRTVLQYDVFVNARLDGGHAAISIAAEKGKRNFVRLLIEHKADVNFAGDDGMTPLMKAARSGDTDTARLLLDAGARMSDLDGTGRQVLDHAGNTGMKQFLEGTYPAEAAERIRQQAEIAVQEATVLQHSIAPMNRLTFKKS